MSGHDDLLLRPAVDQARLVRAGEVSARELMPLVEGFGQDVRVTYDRSGARPKRELSHVLKVFLIDRQGDVREIYTSTFLYPRLVLNDIETLLMEEAGGTSRAPVAK